MSDERTSVLIVGAGPVGLATAAFLGRQGIRPIVVERRSGLSTVPRATGLHARTMEIFRATGIESRVAEIGMEMVAPGADLDRVRAGRATPLIVLGCPTLADLGRAMVIESHDHRYETFTPSPPIWCGQDHYEPLLLEDARAHGVDVRFGVELDSLEQTGEAATATVRRRRTQQTTTIEADYVVAADGSRSGVRSTLGIDHQSHGSAGDFMSIIFHADVPLPADAPFFTFALLFHPKAHGILFRVESDRWMFGVNYYPERGEQPSDFTPERCTEIVRTAVGVPDLRVDVEAASPWRAAHMVADTFRSGRVLLAGDACHTHPPSGGFGVNAGIQDGYNLAWKLAAVLDGWAGRGLLDTYEDERRPVGAATADQAWRLFNSRGGPPDESELADLRDVAVVSNSYRYRSAAVLAENATSEVVPRSLEFGPPGSRLPHVWLDGPDGRISSLDLVGPGFTLLTGSEPNWVDAVAIAGSDLPLRTVAIGPGTALTTPEGRWPDAFGVDPGGAVLVRPDGFVAWRATSATDDPGEVLRDVLDRVLCREPARTESPVG